MKVTLVVFDGVQALDVAGPLDVFAEANLLLPKKDHYDITLVGERQDSVMCSSGMEFKVPMYAWPNNRGIAPTPEQGGFRCREHSCSPQ